MTHHKPLGAVLISSLAIAGAACSSGTNVNLTTVRDAQAATLAHKTTAVTFSVTAGPLHEEGRGAVDLSTDALRITFPAEGVPAIPNGTIVDALVHGTDMWANVHGAAPNLIPAATPWVHLNLVQAASIPGLGLGTISEVRALDPGPLLAFLPGASSATKLGTQVIGGATTTEYRVRLDLGRAAAMANGDLQTNINREAASFSSSTVPGDVWLDATGAVRRLQISPTVKASAGQPATAEQLTYEFSPFGVAVDTSPPPAPQTIELSAILAKAGIG